MPGLQAKLSANRSVSAIMASKNATARSDGPTMAEQADKYDLYELSVQNVENEVIFLQDTFTALRSRPAHVLREDFCGTASACCEWVQQGDAFQAIGVDIDPEVLEWGRNHRVGRLDAADRARVRLIEGNVLTADTPKVDILTAFNFSYFIFDSREVMRNYFRQAYESLVDDGILFLDMYGGPEAQEETKEKTKYKEHGFTYVWHQKTFHPVTNYACNYIHFKFKDGSKMMKAFTYEWRLWSAPEIRELLAEVGFSKATVYWEGTDEDGEGNGEFTPEEKGEADLAWIAYIVVEK
jgi:SAM-dependent methyltransferase